MLPAIEFFKTIKGISISIGIIMVIGFLFFRSCNKFLGEKENENIEIINIDVPLPGEYDANCVRVTGQPCPKLSK